MSLSVLYCILVQVLRRGRAQLLQLGGREIEYNPKFKLYLHTKV